MNGPTIAKRVGRREFVIGATAFTVARAGLASRFAPSSQAKGSKAFAYVGTYTGAPGAGSNGAGVYSFEMNNLSGELTQQKLVAKSPNPSWIAIHPSMKVLYAVNEVSDFSGKSGSVSAFTIDHASGDLTPLNVISSEGAAPCFLSIDPAGKYVFVANYGGGTVAVLPILDGGKLGAATDVERDSANLGAAQATGAPNGSYAVSGHDAPHAHMIAPDPHGKFVLATDLAQDRIYAYRFDPNSGKLNRQGNVRVSSLPSGDGPRHFAFHPNGRWVYSIQEEASNIVFFHYDPETAALAVQQTISALPSGFAGTSFASEILISPSGKHLYAANRLHNTIATFSIGAEGMLHWVEDTPTMGDYPGQFRIDPSGGFLFACNRRSDNITCFKIHSETGRLTFTGQYTAVGSPASIAFMS